MIAGRGKF